MLKKITLIFFILLSINLACATELTTLNEEYNPGETLQAIAYNTSITTSQISLLDSESNSISISPLVTEIREDNYFIYFNLPTDLNEGTYDLLAGPLETNFTITNKTSAIQIKPAFVILDNSKNSFYIQLENVDLATTVIISSSNREISPRKTSLNMASGDLKNLYADYDYSEIFQDETLKFTYEDTTYNIPLYYLEETEEEAEKIIENATIENETIIEENITTEIIEEVEALTFLTESSSANINLNLDESFEGYLNIQNNLNETLYDLTFSLTGNLEKIIIMNLTEVNNLSGQEIISQYLWANKGQDSLEGTYEGELVLSNKEYSTSLPITVTISEELEKEITEDTTSEEEASTFVDYTKTQEDSGSGTTVIGVILILLLLGIFIVLFLRLRKGNEKKFEQYIAETKQK